MTDNTMSRIRDLLASSVGQKEAYRPRRRLAERSLMAWEAKHGLELPDEYRTFLREIGNGGMMPGLYCDFISDHFPRCGAGNMRQPPFQ